MKIGADIVSRLRPGAGTLHYSSGANGSESHVEPEVGCLQCDAATEIETLRRQNAEAAALVADLVMGEECEHDHHGYCQTHGWMDESSCPHGRAWRWLDDHAAENASEPPPPRG